MKKLNEREITKKFISAMLESSIHFDNINPAIGDQDAPIDGESHSELDPNKDGYVTEKDLFNHFDLNNDGVLTTDEYVDHIQYHADNPETLEHYREDVPCNKSYNKCRSYYNDDHTVLKQCVSDTGATCMQSGLQALIDVLTSLKDNGMI